MLRAVRGAHRVAARAGISVLVPLLVVVALGHPEWSAYAAFPTFTSLYGRTSVHLSRVVMQVTAGSALTVALLLGVAVGTLPHRTSVAVGTVAAVAAGSIATAVGIGPSYWATVAAVAPPSAPDAGHRLVRATHRIIGTLLGLGTAAALLAVQLPLAPAHGVPAVRPRRGDGDRGVRRRPRHRGRAVAPPAGAGG